MVLVMKTEDGEVLVRGGEMYDEVLEKKMFKEIKENFGVLKAASYRVKEVNLCKVVK